MAGFKVLQNFMDTIHKCLHCDATMQEGFFGDRSQGTFVVSEWFEGKPEPSFWGGVKTGEREKHEIRTFRCPKCGYLESYAPS